MSSLFFVINLTYYPPLEAAQEKRQRYLQQHRDFLQRYYEQDIFVVSGPKEPLEGGIILARGVTRAELEKIIEEDPFYIHKVAAYEILAFEATKWHPVLRPLLPPVQEKP